MAPAAPLSIASAHGNRLGPPHLRRSCARRPQGAEDSLRAVFRARRFRLLLRRARLRGSQAFMHRRTLFIDAMGTLVTLQAPLPRLVAVLRDRLGAQVTEAQARAALGAEIAYYRAHMGQAGDEPTLRRAARAVRGRAVGGAAAAAGARRRRRRDADRGAARRPCTSPRSPTRGLLLERARGAGARVIVVSNWDVSLGEVLERTGLAAPARRRRRLGGGRRGQALSGDLRPCARARRRGGGGLPACRRLARRGRRRCTRGRDRGRCCSTATPARRRDGGVRVIASLDELSL